MEGIGLEDYLNFSRFSLALAALTLSGAAFSQAIESRDKLKTFFETGDIPTQEMTLVGLGTNSGFAQFSDPTSSVSRKLVGPSRFSHIVLKRGLTNSRAFFDWITSAANRNVKRMGGKISLCRTNGAEVTRYNFFEAWPCAVKLPALDPSSGEALVTEFTLQCDGGFKRSEGNGLKIRTNPEPGEPLTSLDVTIDDLALDVRRIEPVTMSLHDDRLVHMDESDDTSYCRMSSLVMTIGASSLPYFLELQKMQDAGLTGTPPRVKVTWGTLRTTGVFEFGDLGLYEILQTSFGSDPTYQVKLFQAEPLRAKAFQDRL